MLYRVTYWIIATYCVLISPSVLSQTFPCDGKLLFLTNQGFGPSQVYSVFFGPFGTQSYGLMSIYNGRQYDALGFNPVDSYIYAVAQNTNEISRLKSNGTAEVVGHVDFVDTLYVTAGDCSFDGRYYCFDNHMDQLLIMDVSNRFELLDRVDLYWDPNSANQGAFKTQIDDIVLDPNDPTIAYTFQGDYEDEGLGPEATKGFMHSINIDATSPNYGMVTPLFRIPVDMIRQIGSLMYTSNGRLYGYGSDHINFSTLQNKLIEIDLINGVARPTEARGPSAVNTDGCSCPYNLSFSNNIEPRDALCTKSEITFQLSITNRFYQGIDQLRVRDTVPEGMIIKSIEGNHQGQIMSGTGVGEKWVVIEQIYLPPKATITIDIVAEINDIEIDLIANQAFLENLPQRLGSVMMSDDPQSIGFVGDPSQFYGVPQKIEEVFIDVNHPTDCFTPDGSAMVRIPVLTSGESYSVDLRNEDYDIINWQVELDDNNTFLIENMAPGEYELYKIQPNDMNCSFAMRDTTIDIIAPNEIITTHIETNSPICENATLELLAFMSPEGDVTWNGPTLSNHIYPDFIFFDSDTTLNGTYEMIAQYGFCEKTEYTNVMVAPEINATIQSDPEYCSREAIRLKAAGKGMLSSFIWKNPNGDVVSKDSTIDFRAISLADSGFYQLIIDNGLCQDTTNKKIVVHPTPTIALDSVIKTNLCEPLVLNPVIDSERPVEYSWLSSLDKLSCVDCLDPELLLPIDSGYQLIVTNDLGCRDSNMVEVQLLKDKLLYIPNAFSPNGDYKNDQFVISEGCGLLQIDNLEIFDRLGSNVYKGSDHSTILEEPWDGMFNGGRAEMGVYYWRMNMTLADSSQQTLIGDLHLVR